MIKHSKQRESIHNQLMTHHDHPTAETLYLEIKKDFPNISLGTVYRNLSLLADLGEIRKITTGIGPDRFDGNTAEHYHFFCRKCGCVTDIDIDPVDGLNELAAKNFPGQIEDHTVRFYGLCENCLRGSGN